MAENPQPLWLQERKLVPSHFLLAVRRAHLCRTVSRTDVLGKLGRNTHSEQKILPSHIEITHTHTPTVEKWQGGEGVNANTISANLPSNETEQSPSGCSCVLLRLRQHQSDAGSQTGRRRRRYQTHGRAAHVGTVTRAADLEKAAPFSASPRRTVAACMLRNSA